MAKISQATGYLFLLNNGIPSGAHILSRLCLTSPHPCPQLPLLTGQSSKILEQHLGPFRTRSRPPFCAPSHLLLCSAKPPAPLSLNRLAFPALVPLQGCHLCLERPPIFLPKCLTSPSSKLQITSSMKQKELLPPLGTHRTLLQAWDTSVTLHC